MKALTADDTTHAVTARLEVQAVSDPVAGALSHYAMLSPNK